MNNPATSGYFYPSKMGRVILLALEEILGRNGIEAVLSQANLARLIGNYPPDNLEMTFDFAEVSEIFSVLEDLHDSRSGRGLALKAGRLCLKYGLREFAPLKFLSELGFRLLPLPEKLRHGVSSLAQTFNLYSDQIVHLEEAESHYSWQIERCGLCWNRRSPDPACHLAVGILLEATSWVSGGKHYRVEETACIARGDPRCTIVVGKQALEH